MWCDGHLGHELFQHNEQHRSIDLWEVRVDAGNCSNYGYQKHGSTGLMQWNLHIFFEYINLQYWLLMINEHANQNIWQAGVKQFINGMPKPFRDTHGIAVVHQRLGKLSTIHFQLGLRKQSQASVFICLSNHVPAWTAAAKPRLCAPGKVSFKRFNLAAQKSFMLMEIARSCSLTIYIV